MHLQRRNFHVCFPREVRCEAGEGDLGEREGTGGCSGRRADVGTCRMVRGSDGGLLQEEPEPVEWKALAVGAEGMVNCEHMLALLTNCFAETLGVAGGSARYVGSGFKSHTLRSWPAWTCGRRSTWPHRPWCQGYRLAW